MGNILIDMMGLLSRKRVVKTYEDTDMLVLGRRPNADDSIFNTPKMHNELISMKDFRAQFGTGDITGTGTTNTLPLWSDGPNGVLGDSMLSQNAGATQAFVNGKLVGTGGDFYIESQTDDIIIRTTANDKDIFIQSDNGSGQIATYFQADGSTGAAKLFHYGGRKLETTTGGVDLFGTINANGTLTSTGQASLSTNGPISVADLGGNSSTSSQFNIISTFTGDSLLTGTNRLTLKANNVDAIKINNNGEIQFNQYGSGTFTGTAAYNLSVDSSGKVIETAIGSAGVSQTTGTITPTISAGISGISYNDQFGYWTRTGNMVDVFLRVSIGTFTKTNPSQDLKIQDTFPYDIDNNRFFFNGDLMEYVNISDSGTAIPAIYIAKPDVTGTNAYDIKFIRSRNYTLTDSNAITTAEMSTGSFVVELSFRYRCTSSTTLRTGASID